MFGISYVITVDSTFCGGIIYSSHSNVETVIIMVIIRRIIIMAIMIVMVIMIEVVLLRIT